MMNVKDKTDYFITLAEAKIHLRVDSSFIAEDSYILQLIKAATGMAEAYINADIATTANTQTFAEFSGTEIIINEGNYRSVTSVTGSTSGLISSDDYDIVYTGSDFTITLDDSISDETMTIVYNTGYILSTYPANIRQAVLVKIHDLYDPQRGSFSSTLVKNNGVFEGLLNYFVNANFVKGT